jgi:hypothetical protein
MMNLKRWWKRLWQPGEPQPEYVFGPPCSGEAVVISCHNVASVSYYAIDPAGKRLPIYTTDGCPLTQIMQPGHVHATPCDLWSFEEIVPVGLVADPSGVASIECGGTLAVDEVWLEETAVDEGEPEA